MSGAGCTGLPEPMAKPHDFVLRGMNIRPRCEGRLSRAKVAVRHASTWSANDSVPEAPNKYSDYGAAGGPDVHRGPPTSRLSKQADYGDDEHHQHASRQRVLGDRRQH